MVRGGVKNPDGTQRIERASGIGFRKVSTLLFIYHQDGVVEVARPLLGWFVRDRTFHSHRLQPSLAMTFPGLTVPARIVISVPIT